MEPYARREELIAEYRRRQAQRELETTILEEFARLGEATEEEVVNQAEYIQAAEEVDGELRAREIEEAFEYQWDNIQHNAAINYARIAEEDLERVIQNLHETETAQVEAEAAERERQVQLTEQLRAQVTQPEVPIPRINFNPLDGAIRFNTPTAEQVEELRETINNAEPGLIQPVEAPTIRFDGVQNIGAGAITAGHLHHGPLTIGADIDWATTGELTWTPPRRYKIDFNKVNSMEDMVKVLKALYGNHTIDEAKIERLDMKHLVDRVDDRPNGII